MTTAMNETKVFVNTFIYNVEKWPTILLNSCDVNTAKFFKYIWPFLSIMNEQD